MALIITTNINTDGGPTSTAYINISKFEFSKETGSSAYVNLYLNKEARGATPNDLVYSKSIPKRFGASIESIDTSTIYSSLYARLKTLLEDSGFTVVDDI